jgi:type IV pilus assembly protein PilV
MTLRKTNSQRRGGGFTLVEALVALLALSIGLLGVAALQLTGLRNNLSAAWRSQATYLSYDIIDRMRANRDRRLDYNCALGAACMPGGVATIDLAAWKANLAAALPGGVGSVVVDGTDNTTVTVIVQWTDERGAGAQLFFQTVSRI